MKNTLIKSAIAVSTVGAIYWLSVLSQPDRFFKNDDSVFCYLSDDTSIPLKNPVYFNTLEECQTPIDNSMIITH